MKSLHKNRLDRLRIELRNLHEHIYIYVYHSLLQFKKNIHHFQDFQEYPNFNAKNNYNIIKLATCYLIIN